MKNLRVHSESRYLMWDDGKPFFYLGDTAWEMFHKLSQNEISYYLSVRKQQGFNVIQATALAGRDGLAEPNAYGRIPLCMIDNKFDPTKPDEGNGYDYWKHVDFAVEKALEKEMFIALLPTWGDKFNIKWGIGPEIFTPENAYIYGKWIGKRYSSYQNIIWVLGGDRPLETPEHEAIIDSMAKGIREGDTAGHLMTYHPQGPSSSTDYVCGKEYIDFHMIQSGHRTTGYDSWKLLQKAAQAEKKPFMDSEPRYEDTAGLYSADHNFRWNCDDVRQNAYWNLMEGVCGHTYGNNSVWSFAKEDTGYFRYNWQDVIKRDGALQMVNVAKLRMSRPYYEFRAAPELVEDDIAVMAHQAAGRGENYAFIYSPLGLPIRAYLDKLSTFNIKATWFDPRNGKTEFAAVMPPREALFVPPSSGKGNDWVLILDVLIPKKNISDEE